jgi:cysteine desulfurase
MHPAPIYLDHNATTALDPEVLEAMRPYFLAAGNADSHHSFGRKARRAWDRAKETVAHILGADPSEVIFTSGGTEANNLAVFGLAGAGARQGHILSSPIEHPAVAGPLARLEPLGLTVEYAQVTSQGLASATSMAASLRDDTRFVTLMLANNETGAVQPVADLAARAQVRGIPVHTDAVQAVGRIPVHFHHLGVATLAASAHKFHGPVGSGLLLARKGIRLDSWLFDTDRHQVRRPGTVAVPLAVGFAAALQRSHEQAAGRMTRWTKLRDRLEAGLIAGLGAQLVSRNGPATDDLRLPQTLNLAFPGLDADSLLIQLDLAGVAASLGSACASGSTRPSPTLLAMHLPDDHLRSSVRFSLGANTTETEIDEAIKRIITAVERVATAHAD